MVQPETTTLLGSYVNSVPEKEPPSDPWQSKGPSEQSEHQGFQQKGAPSQAQSSTSSWEGKSNWQQSASNAREWNKSSGKDSAKGYWNACGGGWQYGSQIEPPTAQGSLSWAEAMASYGRDSGRDVKVRQDFVKAIKPQRVARTMPRGDSTDSG
eukprot:5479456-Amphidinium_carterae.6